MIRAFLVLLLLSSSVHAQWISSEDAEARRAEQKAFEIWVQCPPGGCCPMPGYSSPGYGGGYYYSEPPRQQAPNVPIVGGPNAPKFTPRPQQPSQPPLQPIPQPTPTIDPKALAELKAEAVAAAKAEVSVLIKNEVSAIQSVPGPPGPAGPQGPPGPSGNPTATKPFYIRVRNPKTGEVTPYAEVFPGKKGYDHVTLDLSPVSQPAQ